VFLYNKKYYIYGCSPFLRSAAPLPRNLSPFPLKRDNSFVRSNLKRRDSSRDWGIPYRSPVMITQSHPFGRRQCLTKETSRLMLQASRLKSKTLEALMAEGMDEEQAQEYFSYNIAGAYVEESTPVFLEDDED
jgi:hypothetical protein